MTGYSVVEGEVVAVKSEKAVPRYGAWKVQAVVWCLLVVLPLLLGERTPSCFCQRPKPVVWKRTPLASHSPGGSVIAAGALGRYCPVIQIPEPFAS